MNMDRFVSLHRITSMLIPKTNKARVRRCGISPLHMAAERNQDDVLEMLLNAGFDPNAMLSDERSSLYEDRRRTSLYFSVANVNLDAVQLLLSHGAAANLDTLPPLMVASRQGAIKTVTLLLEHGADVNVSLLLDHGLKAKPCFNCPLGDKPHPPLSSQSEDKTHANKQCASVCGPGRRGRGLERRGRQRRGMSLTARVASSPSLSSYLH
uniref:Ankyrin repeat and SOCS box containing 2a, tandem duplicate 1 n=1 Tax=Neogobius melanostomus TaxID=47308 RepID=A0A8C6SQ85_9GOBI